jgi:hypothetical protein
MRHTALLAFALAAFLAACTPPPPTNGAQQPVDPRTGVTEGGAGPIN